MLIYCIVLYYPVKRHLTIVRYISVELQVPQNYTFANTHIYIYIYTYKKD